jgi:WS/DGAT/MGAT family acyltransferase
VDRRRLAAPTRRRATLDDLRRAPATLRRELRPTRERSPLDAAIGRRRVVGLADHDLEEVHRAAHAAGDGTTINDVLLSVVAGGLRRWLLERHGAPGPLRAQVPVSMHRPGEAPGAVPNRDSFINVELPVDEADPLQRLRVIGAQTRERKAAHDADELYALFADVGHVSKGLFRLAHRLASNPHVFALSISNVRGPTGGLYFAGGRLRALYSLAEIAPHHALRVSAESAVGRLWIGICADADAVPDLHVLVSGLHESLDELLVALRPPAT